jgi:hypothetical protein
MKSDPRLRMSLLSAAVAAGLASLAAPIEAQEPE